MPNPLENKRIVLGVTGSIAAYKAIDLASKLKQANAQVDVILTESALKFVSTLSFQSVTGSKAFTDAYKAKYNSTPSYHSAGGYAQGLILQKAIEDADSVDPVKVVAALDKLKLMTFYGVVQFSTDAKTHGKQIGHAMALMQWQKDATGKLASQVIWPFESQSADAQIRK